MKDLSEIVHCTALECRKRLDLIGISAEVYASAVPLVT